VITGFNTDIGHNGTTYHVQTEDKGLETPFILTLVYDGGTILASKRQPYEDLFTGGFNEKDLAARLQRQHSLVCAAINAGRIEELIAHTSGKQEKPVEKTKNAVPKPDELLNGANAIPKPGIEANEAELVEAVEPVVEVVDVVEEVIELPEEAVKIVTDLSGKDRPGHNRLCLDFVNETVIRGGERKSLTFMVSRGTERKVVGEAKVVVKILGANIRPQIFNAITDQNGLARMDLELPSFSGGRAAFLVRAISNGEETELRRSILQGSAPAETRP
jgi:hypothetical protein